MDPSPQDGLEELNKNKNKNKNRNQIKNKNISNVSFGNIAKNRDKFLVV
jgi:hypothetical protein